MLGIGQDTVSQLLYRFSHDSIESLLYGVAYYKDDDRRSKKPARQSSKLGSEVVPCRGNKVLECIMEKYLGNAMLLMQVARSICPNGYFGVYHRRGQRRFAG